jgi:hypothetical protein
LKIDPAPHTLNREQEREYGRLLATEKYQMVLPTMLTTYEKGVILGQRQTVRLVLEKCFGALSPMAAKRLEEWPPERLPDLLMAIVDAPSLKALGLEED